MIVGYIIDISFLIDIFLTFFSSFFDEKNLVMVETHRSIAKAYICSWFIFDVISILPLELMINSNNTKAAAAAEAN